MERGRPFDIKPAGMLALDVARIEAGLLLIDVDFNSARKALIPSQKFYHTNLGFGKMVHLDKENFIGKRALQNDQRNGVPRQLVGLEVDWVEVEEQHDKFGLTPAAPTQASRVPVPIYVGDKQVRESNDNHVLAAPQEVDRPGECRYAHSKPGTKLRMELTIEARRLKTTATVVKVALFSPPRKTAVPV